MNDPTPPDRRTLLELDAAALGPGHPPTQPWNDLRKLRNELAHQRLPDIDEDKVWRMTVLRPRALRTLLRELWR